MRNFGKNSPRTGLDVGNSYIKFAQVSGGHDNFLLTNFDVIKVEGKTEDQKKVLERLARSLSVKDVNIAISGPSVVVRYIDLPRMTEEELKSSMKFEAEKYIPFGMKDVILDCQVLENMGSGKMRVLLAAAKKDAVIERVTLVESAGFSVNVVDCDSFALINAFLMNYPETGKDASEALINVGERFTSIEILKGHTAYFTRELEIGGWNFAKAVSEKLGIEITEASALKENPDDKFREIVEVAKPMISQVTEEVKLSLNYFENQMGVVVDKLYLSGDFSYFPGITSIFTEDTGVECCLWDPMKRLKLDKGISQEKLDKVKYQLPVALGLAVRG